MDFRSSINMTLMFVKVRMISRKILLLSIIPLMAIPIGISYGDESSVFQSILDNAHKLNEGQTAYVTTEYSYCTGYADYLQTLDIPIKGLDIEKCLENIENYLNDDISQIP